MPPSSSPWLRQRLLHLPRSTGGLAACHLTPLRPSRRRRRTEGDVTWSCTIVEHTVQARQRVEALVHGRVRAAAVLYATITRCLWGTRPPGLATRFTDGNVTVQSRAPPHARRLRESAVELRPVASRRSQPLSLSHGRLQAGVRSQESGVRSQESGVRSHLRNRQRHETRRQRHETADSSQHKYYYSNSYYGHET